jgi:hypothetical protein
VEEILALTFKVSIVGIGATLLLDLWSLFLKAAFAVPFPSYPMIGRWLGYFPRGRFSHASVSDAPAVAGERLIGWSAHYVIGVLYAALLVAVVGVRWLSVPALLPALLLGIVTVAAPFFLMQPAMGYGIASSKTPKPNNARLRSLAAHTVFGLGLYLSGVALAAS